MGRFVKKKVAGTWGTSIKVLKKSHAKAQSRKERRSGRQERGKRKEEIENRIEGSGQRIREIGNRVEERR